MAATTCRRLEDFFTGLTTGGLHYGLRVALVLGIWSATPVVWGTPRWLLPQTTRSIARPPLTASRMGLTRSSSVIYAFRRGPVPILWP